jgi:menaquinone-dependent protoporphyrinogen oxidase
MTVLVTYGSTRGGTQGLAETVVGALRSEGLDVELASARSVRSVSGYEAVIVGGALYAFRWHRDARRFVKRHAAELCRRPTYFFSSGPLDDSAAQGEIPPVKGVDALMRRVGARGHATFGGRLSPDARGFPARAMAKTQAGDWRDGEQVAAWVRSIAPELHGVAPPR